MTKLSFEFNSLKINFLQQKVQQTIKLLDFLHHYDRVKIYLQYLPVLR